VPKTTHCIVALSALALAMAVIARAEVGQGQDIDPVLKKAADARTTARDSADGDSYGRYTLDDAWIVSPSGGFRLTQENVEALKSLTRGLLNPRVSEERYRVLGDSAIRTYRRDITDPNGQNYAVRFLESWVKQNGEWKLAAEWFRNITAQ
jgi:ketosteroid isomerase-like protein